MPGGDTLRLCGCFGVSLLWPKPDVDQSPMNRPQWEPGRVDNSLATDVDATD